MPKRSARWIKWTVEPDNLQIRALGDEYLKLFGDALFEILNRHLSKRLGPTWFKQSYKHTKGRKSSAKKAGQRDVYTIIHQVLIERNNDFRSALNKEFKSPDNGVYLMLQLEKVLKARNKWSHPHGVFGVNDLLALLRPMYNVFGNREDEFGERCRNLIETLQTNNQASLIMFSAAFGKEYLEIEKKNFEMEKLLQQMKEQSARSGELIESSDIKPTINIIEDYENLIQEKNKAIEELYWNSVYFHHHGDAEILKLKLLEWAKDLLVLILQLDFDFVYDQIEHQELWKIDNNFTPDRFSDVQMRDLIRFHFGYATTLFKEVEKFYERVQPETCECSYCEITRKYDFPVLQLSGDFQFMQQIEYIVEHIDESVIRIVDEEFEKWLVDSNTSKEVYYAIFGEPDLQGQTLEGTENGT